MVYVRKKRTAIARRPLKGRTTKTYRKRRTAIRRPFSVNIAPITRVCLRYNEPVNYSLAVGNGYTLAQVFRPNCLYDPNFTGSGHQGMMRDQWYQLYEYGKCMGYSYKITVMTDSDSPIDVHLTPTTTSATIAFEQATETRGSRMKTMQKYKPVVMTHKAYVDRSLGNPKGTWTRDDLFKQSAGSPLVDKASVWLQLGAISRASTTANVWIRIQLLQYVAFVEPIYQNQS